MKRFCKAAGHQVNEPDVFFHLISYAIELAMIQVQQRVSSILKLF